DFYTFFVDIQKSLTAFTSEIAHHGSKDYSSGLRPEIILYSTTMMAITSRMWIRFPIPIPLPTPINPRTQTIMHITATSHNIPLIKFIFRVNDRYYFSSILMTQQAFKPPSL